MITLDQIERGSKVHYKPAHYADDQFENGIVKEIRPGVDHAVWVVYNCAGNWDRYFDYTSAKTRLEDLFFGWL